MTPTEQAAFNAGVEAMRQMEMIAAVTIEIRDDANGLRQRSAAAALHGLAEGAMGLMLERPVSCCSSDINRGSDPTSNLL